MLPLDWFLRLVVFVALYAFALGSNSPCQKTQEAFAQRHYFYVGGSYVQGDAIANGTIITGQIYVEQLTPLNGQTQPYPLVFWHGGVQTGTNFLNTPDGRQGWASFFLERGYVVVSSGLFDK